MSDAGEVKNLICSSMPEHISTTRFHEVGERCNFGGYHDGVWLYLSPKERWLEHRATQEEIFGQPMATAMSKMLSKPKMEILIGPPGSGKSTYAGTLDFWTYINQDRQGKNYLRLFDAAVANGEDIVVDRMNFSKKQREHFIAAGKANDYVITIRVFAVPYDVCLERCQARCNHATIRDEYSARDALRHFFTKFERPTEDEGNVVWVGHDKNRYGAPVDNYPAVVIDLDGTLSDCSLRQHLVQGTGKKDWKEFFNELKNDAPNTWCVELAKAMRERGYAVIFASGRPDTYRELTMEWLARADLYPHRDFDWLFMRPQGDFRRDDIAKEIILDFEVLTRVKPVFFVDDRKQVVDMYRRRGFTVLQCALGDF